MPRAPARIEWSPDGTRFASRLPDHRIRLHAEDGSVLRSLGRALDVQWSGEQVMSIDDRGTVRYHGPGGVDHQHRLVYSPDLAWFAYDRVAIATSREVVVVELGTGKHHWKLDPKKHDVPPPAQLAVALAWSGKRIAIAFATEHARVIGRGFVVIDLVEDRVVERDFVALGGLVDAPIGFAFDRDGNRFAMTHPERFPALGVVDLGVPGDRIRDHPGGVSAVALDAQGMIAAYAYDRRLEFDFLEPEARGGSVAVESTLAFDPDLPDVIAVGFDPHSRWLACLASTGVIEILPVP